MWQHQGQELSRSGQQESSRLDHCAVWPSIVLVWTPQCLGSDRRFRKGKLTRPLSHACKRYLQVKPLRVRRSTSPQGQGRFLVEMLALYSCIESQRMLLKPQKFYFLFLEPVSGIFFYNIELIGHSQVHCFFLLHISPSTLGETKVCVLIVTLAPTGHSADVCTQGKPSVAVPVQLR